MVEHEEWRRYCYVNNTLICHMFQIMFGTTNSDDRARKRGSYGVSIRRQAS